MNVYSTIHKISCALLNKASMLYSIKRKIIISNTTGTFFVIICVVAEKCNKE